MLPSVVPNRAVSDHKSAAPPQLLCFGLWSTLRKYDSRRDVEHLRGEGNTETMVASRRRNERSAPIALECGYKCPAYLERACVLQALELERAADIAEFSRRQRQDGGGANVRGEETSRSARGIECEGHSGVVRVVAEARRFQSRSTQEDPYAQQKVARWPQACTISTYPATHEVTHECNRHGALRCSAFVRLATASRPTTHWARRLRMVAVEIVPGRFRRVSGSWLVRGPRAQLGLGCRRSTRLVCAGQRADSGLAFDDSNRHSTSS